MTGGVPEEPFPLTARDRVTLHVRRWRAVAAPGRWTFVVVHGLGEHSGRYVRFADWFARRGVTLYAMDQRGHGLSGGPRGHAQSLPLLVDDVDRVVERARQESSLPVVLVGHSFGGLVAIAYALACPTRLQRAVFSAPALVVRARVPRWKRVLGRVLPSVLPRLTMSNQVDPRVLSRDPGTVEAYRADPLVHDRISARLYRETLGRGEDLIRRAPELRVPFLLLHGAQDRLIDPAGSQRFFDRAVVRGRALRIYDGLYHEIFNEPEQQRIFQDIIGWLEDREAAGPVPPGS